MGPLRPKNQVALSSLFSLTLRHILKALIIGAAPKMALRTLRVTSSPSPDPATLGGRGISLIYLRRLQEAATGNVLRADILGEGRNYERRGCIAEGL